MKRPPGQQTHCRPGASYKYDPRRRPGEVCFWRRFGLAFSLAGSGLHNITAIEAQQRGHWWGFSGIVVQPATRPN